MDNFLENHKLKQDDVAGLSFVFNERRFLFLSRHLKEGKMTGDYPRPVRLTLPH